MKQSDTAQRLRQIMDEKHLRQIDVLKCCEPYFERFGVKIRANDLSQYLSGRSLPNQKRLTILGLALGVSEVWLMGYDVPREREGSAIPYKRYNNIHPLTPFVKLPKLGEIHAGPPIDTDQGVYGEWDYADEVYGNGEHYILDVVGDSMSPTIPDGSEAIIHIQNYAKKGDIVVFGIDRDCATLKRYYPQPDGSILLRGDNPEAECYVVTPEQLANGEATIFGVAVSYKVRL